MGRPIPLKPTFKGIEMTHYEISIEIVDLGFGAFARIADGFWVEWVASRDLPKTIREYGKRYEVKTEG